MTAHSLDALLATLLSRPGMERRRMLKSDGLAYRSRFFAVLDPDGLVLRLPPRRAAALAESGVAIPYQAGARVMKGWVKLTGEFDGDLAPLAEEAIAALDPA